MGAARRRRPLAIATVRHVSSRVQRGHLDLAACGFTKWCLSAHRLVELLGGNAEVVVATTNESFVASECWHSSPRVVRFDERLWRAARRWVTSADLRGSRNLRPAFTSAVQLMKWQFVGLVEYEVIFVSDNDVDFFFTPSAMAAHRANWGFTLHRFRHSRSRLLGTADFASPFNAAAFLLRPSLALYESGAATLLTARFNVTHGFNLSGPPVRLLHPLDARRFRIVDAVRSNHWDFVGGHADQGLFTYIFLMREVPRYNRSTHLGLYELTRHCPFLTPACTRSPSICPIPVTHFWGAAKPWEGLRCPRYFQQFADLNASLEATSQETPARTHCFAHLRRAREELAQRSRRAAQPAADGDQAVRGCGGAVQCLAW